ncbi:MAG: hypothetical protein NTW85_04420 [Methylococcales bacterium]|nr:hypothetical protein [Methylococcales bacterium]
MRTLSSGVGIASNLRVAAMNATPVAAFDDLTDTVLAWHHQPLSTCILSLYFMGLNLSNAQITQELDLHKDDLQVMTEHLRDGINKKRPDNAIGCCYLMSFIWLQGSLRKSSKPPDHHASDA